jgi:hypothetical protein
MTLGCRLGVHRWVIRYAYRDCGHAWPKYGLEEVEKQRSYHSFKSLGYRCDADLLQECQCGKRRKKHARQWMPDPKDEWVDYGRLPRGD